MSKPIKTPHYTALPALVATAALAGSLVWPNHWTRQPAVVHAATTLPSGITMPATGTINYVAAGQVVQTTTFQGQTGQSGTYVLAAPAGYQLTGDATLAYTLSAVENVFTVQVKPAVATVSATVSYLYQGQLVNAVHFTGSVGENGIYYTRVPNGYHLATGQATSFAYQLKAGDNQFTVELTKSTATVPATITYLANGAVVKRDYFTGSVGETGTRTLTAPAGYQLLGGASLSYQLTAGTNQYVVNVAKTQATATIQYVVAGRVIKVATVTGPVAGHLRYQLQPPAGYSLLADQAGILSIDFDQPMPYTIELTPLTATPRDPLLTLTVVDQTTGRLLDAYTIQGRAGEPLAVNSHALTAPYTKAGYQVVSNPASALTTFPHRSTTMRIEMQKKALQHSFARPLPAAVAALIPETPTSALSDPTASTSPAGQQRERPMVFAPFGLNEASEGGDDGGGGGTGGTGASLAAGAMALAAYWQTLSGIINFGVA